MQSFSYWFLVGLNHKSEYILPKIQNRSEKHRSGKEEEESVLLKLDIKSKQEATRYYWQSKENRDFEHWGGSRVKTIFVKEAPMLIVQKKEVQSFQSLL